jgi:hypothetical protein
LLQGANPNGFDFEKFMNKVGFLHGPTPLTYRNIERNENKIL